MNKSILEFLDNIYKSRMENQKYYTFGYQKEYQKMPNYDLGYVPFIKELEFTEKENFISLTNPKNRPGILKNKTLYVCVHDTASGAPSADELAHERWLSGMASDINSNTWVSWHYTVGEKYIIHHIPNDEVAYHAGDGTSTPLEFINTNIKNDKEKVNIEVGNDNYFYVNGKKTFIAIPQDENGDYPQNAILPMLGINYKIDNLGNIYLGNTYYNKGYNTISNRGGNLNSIGIETCVNYGSDYTKTMRNCAYLVSKLCKDYNLPIENVLQHNSFSGKDCPKTLRFNNRWWEFINLVSLNMEYNELSNDYDISFISLNPDYLNKEGKIIKHEEGKEINYKCVVINKKTNERFEKIYKFKLGKLNYEKD